MTEISLRRTRVEDAELLHEWRSESGTRRHQPILQLPLEELRSALSARSALQIGPTAIGNFQFMIQADGVPVGWITLEITDANRRHGIGEIGYTIGAPFRGNGYGAAGLALLLPVAIDRQQFNLERLEAKASVENIASCRVLMKSGFHREGTARGLLVIDGRRIDHATFGLLRSDLEAR